jgi:hypothetical protein
VNLWFKPITPKPTILHRPATLQITSINIQNIVILAPLPVAIKRMFPKTIHQQNLVSIRLLSHSSYMHSPHRFRDRVHDPRNTR